MTVFIVYSMHVTSDGLFTFACDKCMKVFKDRRISPGVKRLANVSTTFCEVLIPMQSSTNRLHSCTQSQKKDTLESCIFL